MIMTSNRTLTTEHSEKIYEILDGAKEKDSIFQNNRPIPLTENESSNYIKKDSIAKAHKAPAYIILDREANRFRWRNIWGKDSKQ